MSLSVQFFYSYVALAGVGLRQFYSVRMGAHVGRRRHAYMFFGGGWSKEKALEMAFKDFEEFKRKRKAK